MAEEKKDFVVKDRRIFSQDSPGSEKPDDEKQTSPAGGETAAAGEPSGKSAEDASPPPPPLPEINFATFVASLNASALLHLGAIEDPATGKKAKNLPMAKQTIDILSMLEEKTAGNLATDEAHFIKNILYDLRIMYVKEKG